MDRAAEVGPERLREIMAGVIDRAAEVVDTHTLTADFGYRRRGALILGGSALARWRAVRLGHAR